MVPRIVFGVLYWYIRFVALPRRFGYTMEEEVDILTDGTSFTRLISVINT